MSTKTKSTAGKSAAVPVEPFVPYTPVPEGIDPSCLPFPEWSDQGLNAEQWDVPKSKVSTTLLRRETFLGKIPVCLIQELLRDSPLIIGFTVRNIEQFAKIAPKGDVLN